MTLTRSEPKVGTAIEHVDVDMYFLLEHFAHGADDGLGAAGLQRLAPVREPAGVVLGVHQGALRHELPQVVESHLYFSCMVE